MSHPHILTPEDVQLLLDVLARRSLSVRECILDGSLANPVLVAQLLELSAKNLALDRMNLFINQTLAKHFAANAEALETWIRSKSSE